MSCSPVLKWFLILALPLTLGSKLIVRPDRSAPSEKDVQQRVAKFLDQQRFTVALSDQLGEAMTASKGAAWARNPSSRWTRDHRKYGTVSQVGWST